MSTRIIRHALRARRFALRAQRMGRPALCACRAARLSATRSRRRGQLGATQSPSRASFLSIPRGSPLRLNTDVPTERSRGFRALRKTRHAFSWHLSDKERVYTGGTSVTTHACSIAPRPYVLHATRSPLLLSYPCQCVQTGLQTLERSLREPRELPDPPEPMPRVGQTSSADKHTLAWS